VSGKSNEAFLHYNTANLLPETVTSYFITIVLYDRITPNYVWVRN